jgi:hypothetical protein
MREADMTSWSYRSWMWIVCNEVGFFQEGAPIYWPSLVSRLVNPPYDIVSAMHDVVSTKKMLTDCYLQRQCSYFFPEAYAKGQYAPNVAKTNAKYDGWFVHENNLFFANGQRAFPSSSLSMYVAYPWMS